MTAQMTERQLKVNGIDMHITQQGGAARHALSWLAGTLLFLAPSAAGDRGAGFHAVAPDMRGYGRRAHRKTSPRTAVSYHRRIIALVAALGEKQAIVIGHDWGAPIAWHCAMFRPDVFTAVVGLSVPPYPRGPARPLGMLRRWDSSGSTGCTSRNRAWRRRSSRPIRS